MFSGVFSEAGGVLRRVGAFSVTAALLLAGRSRGARSTRCSSIRSRGSAVRSSGARSGARVAGSPVG
jgi:hypothetical protein